MDGAYDIRDFPPFAVTVDLVALTIRDDRLSVLLVRRGREPFRGRWALPGGFVQRGPGKRDESLDEAAAREFEEETGLPLEAAYLTQLGAYGDPGRDPRGNIVTVAYLAVAPSGREPRAGGDAAAARWQPVGLVLSGKLKLAFDHGRIVADAVRRSRELIETTALALAFCDEPFTMPQLRRVYEAVWDLPPDTLDAGNFHKRMLGVPGLIEPAEDDDRFVAAMRTQAAGRGRPPQLFRAGPLVREKGPAARLDRAIERPWETRREWWAGPLPRSRPVDAPAARRRPMPAADAARPSPSMPAPRSSAGAPPRDLAPGDLATATRRARHLIWQRGLAGRGVSYGELAAELGLHWYSGDLFAVLDALTRDEVAAGGPLVSVLVTGQKSGLPNERFFRLAEELGRTVARPREFAEAERAAALAWIRAHPERATAE